MRRRRLLTLLGGVALAGCSGPDAGIGTEPRTLSPVELPETEHSRTEQSTSGTDGTFAARGPFGEASVVNLRTGPRTLSLFPVRYERDDLLVDLRFTATATVTQPARLAMRLTNRSKSATQVDLSTLPPLGTVLTPAGTAGAPAGRLLVPTGADLDARRPRIERGPAGYWRASASPPALPERLTVDPDTTRTGTLLLLGEPDARGFPLGRYGSGGTAESLSLAVWDTGAPGPRGDSRFDRGVPPLPNTLVTDWFHEATARTGIYLRPTVERGAAPQRFRFTLVNHTVDPLGGNPADWKLYKLVDGAWHQIAPWSIDLSAGAIPPGGAFPYVIAASHGTPPGCECLETGGPVGYLGGGLYALEAGYSRVRTSETYAALFRLDAPGLRVEPSDDVSVDQRAGTTVVTRPEWRDGEEPPDETTTVTRSDATAAPLVIPEQVYRRPYRALRDVVPYLADPPVVIRTDAGVVADFVGRGAPSRQFEYDDERYVATRGDATAEQATTEQATGSD